MNLFEMVPMENLLVWVRRELYFDGESDLIENTIYDGDNPKTLPDYISAMQDLLNYLLFSVHTLIITLIYARRLVKNGLHIGDLNVKRVLLSCFSIAMKYHDDNSITNRSLARLTAMKIKDISRLEAETLSRLDYTVHVTLEEWLETLNELIYESKS